ncbi:calmodulin-lysine N-methyltransferase isoform X2 [Synchiropus splendidus]|uniref:calmodulin-lysine N-methyltransferase isoform X2 n=1 Tax=Synchiropus splendidus TaxID=270530 RepID=UPI00237D64D4|nr:calmodulin-lysine N-methyltransferase isoform X2 [Synchiropus splendidus]
MYKTEEECAGAPGDCDPASTSRRDFNKNTCGTESLRPSEGTGGSAEVARARWTLLRQVLRQKQADSPDVKQVSVRRFATFDLFCRKPVKPDTSDDTDDQWVEYRSVRFPEFSALLRDNLGPLRVNEVLNSFDNTGNVCVWPSEEVMAHYCLQNRHIFKGAVCELGGGMTCLAGIMVAICADVTEVLLSDGNEKSIQNVRGVIERNKQAGLFGSANVSSSLFLDQYRASLVDAIRRLLQPNGRALVFAPLRGETLRQFCRLAVQAGLCVSQSQRYDAHVWDIHQKMLKEGKDTYDENIHFPNLITLTKEPQSSSH